MASRPEQGLPFDMSRLPHAASSELLDEFPSDEVDLLALEANLALTPVARVAELVEMNRLHHDVQTRSLSRRQRELLWQIEVGEARDRLGPDDRPR